MKEKSLRESAGNDGTNPAALRSFITRKLGFPPVFPVIMLFCTTISFTSCSTTRLATRAMVPIIENIRDVALAYPDLATFLQATPSNLFLIEGLIKTDPGNKRLRLTASMLYFSYAFASIEEKNEAYASYLYLKGFSHGRDILFRDRKIRDGWKGKLGDFTAILDRFAVKDVPAMLWTAANWAQFISLHLDSTAVLPDIPRVTALLGRVCQLDGSYFEGLPHIMLGSLHAFRPPMMGGDPEASRDNFRRAKEISGGKFFLTYYFYARHYCYRTQDAKEFEQALETIISQGADVFPRYRLLNEIAKEKARRLLRDKDELF